MKEEVKTEEKSNSVRVTGQNNQIRIDVLIQIIGEKEYTLALANEKIMSLIKENNELKINNEKLKSFKKKRK